MMPVNTQLRFYAQEPVCKFFLKLIQEFGCLITVTHPQTNIFFAIPK